MRLSHAHKISARVPPQLREAIDAAVTRLKAKGVKYLGRKIGIEAVTAAAFLEFFDRPLVQQVEILEGRISELEAMLREEPNEIPQGTIVLGDPSRQADSTGKPSRRKA